MKIIFLELLKGLLLGVCFVLFFLILATCSRSVYSNTVHPHGESVLTDCKDNIGAQSERAFFVRILSMPLRISMQALGGGHLRVCWFPFVPVC